MRSQHNRQNRQNINNDIDQYQDNQDINDNYNYRDNYNNNRQNFDDDRLYYDDNQNYQSNNNRRNYQDNQYKQNDLSENYDNNYRQNNNIRNNYNDNLFGQNNNNRDNYNDNNQYNQNNRDNYNDNQFRQNNNNNRNNYNDNQYRQKNNNNRNNYNDSQYRQNNNNRNGYNDNDNDNDNQFRQNNNNNRNEYNDNQYRQNNNNRNDYNDRQNNNNRNNYNDIQYRQNNNNKNRDDYSDNQYRQNNNNRINNNVEQYRKNSNMELNNNSNQYRQRNIENVNRYQNNEFSHDDNNINQIPNYKVNNIINERNGKLDFLTSPITASINEYVDKNIDNSQVIFYRIKVTDHINNKSWNVERRYNDFVNIHKKLSINFSDMPNIPGKTFFKVSDFAQIKKRKDGLHQFIQSCVNRKDIYSSIDFKNFLEIKKHSPHLCGNNPELVGAFSITQTVRDFQYLPEEKILFLCSAELNLIERAESKITDLKNSKEISNPQGFAYIYSVEESYNTFSFKELWKKRFKGRVKSIYYDRENSLYFIGRTDGYISIYSLNKESNFKVADLLVELRNHLSAVTGMWYDSYDKKLYSVSTDKRFVSSEIYSNKKLTEINKSQTEYTRLKPDFKNYLLITATEGGVIDIYSYRKFPPNKISSTSILSLGNIRDFYINNIHNYIYTCDTKGKISILDFGSNTKSCLQISQFKGKISLRNIIYDENKKNLITGDEIGNITIWCMKTGQPIFSWVAHSNSAITKLYYDNADRILVSGAKDKNLKFWKLPNEWINEDVVKFENEGLKNINNEIARRRIKAQKEFEEGIENDFDSDLSQEDDLNGWNYRKDK